MTIDEAISKIRVLLSGEESVPTEEPTSEKVEQEFDTNTLVDGSVVKTDGAIEVGKVLYVETPEGDVPAPQGVHQTTDDLLISVDENGTITAIEPFVPETPVEQSEESSQNFSTEDMVGKFTEILTPLMDELSSLREQVSKINSEFQEFREEPAGKKITNNISDNAKIDQSLYEAKMSKLMEIRRNKK